jgi:8-oxo-dGTP pyrophosphatase MutT (NUDIX family)
VLELLVRAKAGCVRGVDPVTLTDRTDPMAVPVPQPASTVTLVRDAPGGIEVLLLQRAHTLKFMPGAYVFPGGALDPEDSSPDLCAMCAGLEDETASRALGLERGGMAYWIAAIREAFEEAGILLAYDAEGEVVDTRGAAQRYRAHRRALDQRRGHFGGIVRGEGLRLAVDRLTYFGHWITPERIPRRYDTRFFLAVAPERQEAMHDNQETIAHVWIRPEEALDAQARERLGLRFPTIRTLEEFAGHATASGLVAALASRRVVRPLLPRFTRDGRQVLPGEPGYDEAGAPEG